MFALLFDRKSLTMTLLALGCMGLLLFVSGFALGSYLNGGLEQLDVVAQEEPPTTPRAASGTTAPASRRSTRQPSPRAVATPEVIEVDHPAPPEPEATNGASGASGPPADWVPPFDGAPWPGEEPGQEATTEEALTAQMTTREMATTEMADPEMAASEIEPSKMVVPEIQTASMGTAKASFRRTTGFYYIQLGTFSREELALEKRDEAQSLAADLKDENIASFLAPVADRGGRTAYAVRVGPFPTRSAAREAAAGHGRASIVWSPSGRTL